MYIPKAFLSALCSSVGMIESANFDLDTQVSISGKKDLMTYSGDATFFYPGLGACGAVSKSTDLIVALSTAKYEGGAHCYKHIGVHYQGKFVDATVVDECLGCGPNDIDLSPSAYSHLASQDLGRVQVTWNFE